MNIMFGYVRIRRAEFYRNGGFSSTRQVRITRSGHWTYWFRIDD